MLSIKPKIKNFYVPAVIFGGILLCFAILTPEKAAAQQIPDGSYRKSCHTEAGKKEALIFGHELAMECRQKNGSYRPSLLRFVFLCAGDIGNNDGHLTCAKDATTQSYKTARESLSAAMVLILGRDLQNVHLPVDGDDAGKFDHSPGEMLEMLADLFAAGRGQDYSDGLDLKEATGMVKKYMHQKELEPQAVDNAYKQVYKRPATGDEQAKWLGQVKNGSETYASLVLKLQQEKASSGGKK